MVDSLTSEFKVVDYPVSQLAKLKNPKNPRWMPDQQMEALTASLAEFGTVEPVILNTRTNRIVGGHQRIDAATANDEKTLPTVLVDLEPAEETALNLALNKVKGEWDYEKLAVMLADISPDQLLATGFTEIEQSSLIASFQVDDEEIADEQDSGVVRDIRNRTEEEVKDSFESTEKVQFGMFSKAIPVEIYQQWVDSLKAKTTMGESPISLGLVVAEMLGIEVIQEKSATEDEDKDLENEPGQIDNEDEDGTENEDEDLENEPGQIDNW
ncbi:MAG: ParB N-terminal domain-containing protein [Kovacikia sp.]